MRRSERLAWPGDRFTAALAAGLASLIVAILVSLPLQSPHDALMNSATIALAGAITAVGLAYGWHTLTRSMTGARPVLWFAAVNLAALAVTAVAAFIIQSTGELERAVSFIVPLAAILFIGAPILTQAFDRVQLVARWSLVALAIAVIGLGVGLSGQGDQKSGRLSLPERSN